MKPHQPPFTKKTMGEIGRGRVEIHQTLNQLLQIAESSPVPIVNMTANALAIESAMFVRDIGQI